MGVMPGRMLALATVGFLVNFWAWALISPLGAAYGDELGRSTDGHDLVVAPLHDALRREGWSAMATQLAADFFHPDDRGHRVWAEAFWGGVLASPVGARLLPAR